MPPRPLPTIAGVVRAAVTGLSSSNQKWVNVHHLQYAGGASTPGITEITAADALLFRLYSGTAFAGGNPWMSYATNGWQTQQIDYTVLDGTSLGYTIAHAVVGSAVQPSLPAECSPVLTLLTGRRGRRYRGRIFLPAPATTYTQADGRLSTVPSTAITQQYQGMITALAAIQWVPVVASYGVGSYKGQPTSWTPFATPITSTRMDLFIDVQRRRKN